MPDLNPTDLVQNIRAQYAPQQPTQLDTLRALDRKVKAPAKALAWTLGTIGTLLLGGGMSLIMSDFGRILSDLAMPVGIGLGIAGIAILISTYPLYCRILKKKRAQFAPEILRLADELIL